MVFLLSPSWSLFSPFQQNMLEENLRVTREVPTTSSCIPSALIGSILDTMSLHIPMRQGFRGWVAPHCVTSLGLPVSGCQRTASLVRRLNLITTYSGRRRNFSARCYKRICEVITVICLQALEAFLPGYMYHYSLNGNNKFVLCHGLGPI